MNKIENNNLNYQNLSNEFKFDESRSNLKISFERIAFIFFIFFVIAIIFSSKVIFLGFKKSPEAKKVFKKENFRSTILDSDGNILAKTVPIINLGINPNLIIDREKLILNLKILFPDKNFRNKIYGKKFFYVKKQISQTKLDKILLLGDKSFIQEESIVRIYPDGKLFK